MLTQEQSAIVEVARAGKQDILIEATAGSGKTRVLTECMPVIPQRSILVTAFNKRIADELTARAPKLRRGWAMHVKTFHAIGRAILARHFPTLEAEKNGTESIITQANDGNALPYPMQRAAVKILRHFKEITVDNIDGPPPDLQRFHDLGANHDYFGKLADWQIDEVLDVVANAYALSFHPESLKLIDFCDMIWMPLALNLTPPSRYQCIIVDEWQDMNEPQLELVRRLRAPGSGRLIMAGDGRQAVNGWRGAVAGTVRAMMTEEHNAKVMSLTTSFRCSKAVIGAAKALVPEINAWDEALEGSVSTVGMHDVPRMLAITKRQSDKIHTFILGRANAALLDTALYLWREGARFQLNAGQEMLKPLFDMLDVLDLSSPPRFCASLEEWHKKQSGIADSLGSVELQDRVDEQRTMMLSALNYVAPSGMRRLFNSILEPGNTGVMLSTVHKVKGLEADRVFLLKQSFRRHQRDQVEAFVAGKSQKVDPAKVQKPERSTVKPPNGQTINVGDWINDKLYETVKLKPVDDDEELNIEYVAITRAKEHLIWINMGRGQEQGIERGKLTDKLIKSLSIEALEDEYIKAEGEIARLDSIGEPGADDEAAEWAQHAQDLLAEIKRRSP